MGHALHHNGSNSESDTKCTLEGLRAPTCKVSPICVLQQQVFQVFTSDKDSVSRVWCQLASLMRACPSSDLK